MAKKRNLLLTTLLAAVCLTALLVASFVVGGGESPAQAATEYEYKATGESNIKVSESPSLLVGTYASKTYALYAYNSTTIKVKEVSIVDGKIDTSATPVDDSMLWIIAGGSYKTIQNKSNNNYIFFQNYWTVGLSSSASTFGSSSYIQECDSDNYATLYIKSTTEVGASKNDSTSFTQYIQREKLNAPTAITFNGGSVTHVDGKTLNASGSMPAQEVEKGSSFTLPECKFTLSLYSFDGWDVKIGEAEVIKKQIGDTITITADTTLTATWVANYWTVTYTTEGTLLADAGLANTTLTIEKEKSANLGSKLSDRWSGAADPDGYIFDGWAMADTGEKITNYTWYKPTADITVKPVFVKGIKIVYNWNGGVAPTSTYAYFKNETKKPTDSYTLYVNYSSASYLPTKSGYVFAGWTCNNGKEYIRKDTTKNETERVDSSYETYHKLTTGTYAITKASDLLKDVSGNSLDLDEVVLTAIWQFDGFTLTFKVGDQVYMEKTRAKGTAPYNYKFADNGVTVPDAPEGKVFQKWTTTSIYNDYNGDRYYIGGSDFDYSTQYVTLPYQTSTSERYRIDNYNVELVAVFGDLFTATFQTDDGTVYKTHTVNVSSSASSVTLDLSKTEFHGTIPQGSAVQGFTTANGDEYGLTTITINRTSENFPNITLIVHYATMRTVHFDLGGASLKNESTLYDDRTAAEESVITLPLATDMTYDKHRFVGWNDGTKTYDAGASYTVNGDVTFTAVWTDKATITIHYAGETKTIQKNVGYFMNNPTGLFGEVGFEVADKIFQGLFSDAAMTQKISSFTVNDNVEWWAKAADAYTVVLKYGFKDDEGNDVPDVTRTLAVGTEYTLPTNVTRKMYVMSGWATEEGGEKVYEPNGKVSSACTLYAVWTPNWWVITLNINDTPYEFHIEKGAKFSIDGLVNELEHPEEGTGIEVNKAHFTISWWDVKNEDTVRSTSDDITATKDNQYRASYRPIEYTISFNTAGGSTIAPIKGAFGTAVTAPEAPTKEGAIFVKWTLNGNDYEFTTMPDTNPTLTAVWEYPEYTLTIDLGNGSAATTDQYIAGRWINKPEDPTRSGYEFKGWTLNGQSVTWQYDSSDRKYYIPMPARDSKLLATWEITEAGLEALKTSKLNELTAYATENTLDVPANGISAATSEQEVLSAFNTAKQSMEGIVSARITATQTLAAYAISKGVEVPANGIAQAKTIEAINQALEAGKTAVDQLAASKAKVDAAKQAIAALSGKTGEALFNQLKAVDAALADLSAEEKARVELTAYNTAKAQLEALVSGAEADLEAANTAGATIAAAKIGAAVAALASLAALAFVLKRGIL